MDHSQEFKSFLNSALGKELVKDLEEMRASKLNDAEKESSIALLNQAYGIRLALEHLQFRAIVPGTKGDKGKTQ